MTPDEIDEVNTSLWAELDEIKEKTGYNDYCAASTTHRWTLLGYLLNLKRLVSTTTKSDITTRKIFVCKHCEGIYADSPVSQCDCLEGSGSDFIEGFAEYKRLEKFSG